MKKIKLALSLLLLGSTCLIGCKNNTSEISGEDGRQENEVYFKGIHKFTAPEANSYLVKSGKTDYKIVIPFDADPLERKAKEEFLYFFKKATGIDMSVIDDSSEEISSSGRYIYIGETAFTNVEHSKSELGEDGLIIKSKQNSVYLVGGSSYGTLNAVYDFMKIMFNYEQFSTETYFIDTDVYDLKMRKFDVKDIPDIPLRAKGYGFLTTSGVTYDEQMFGYRMRMTKGRGEFFMPVFDDYSYSAGQSKSTNCDWYLPYDKFGNQHPEWFSDNIDIGNKQFQFCYTAHGDSEEYDLMVQEVAHKIIFSCQHFTPDIYPEMNVITCTMQDNFRTCTCPACEASAKKYGGAYSAAVVQFINNVGDIVKDWMEDPDNAYAYRENFRIIYFAYNAFEQSPTYFDEATKTYKPYDDSVILRDNTGIYFAEINQMDYQRSMFDKANEWGKSLLDGWCVLTDFLYYWTYETNFSYYLYPYDSFSFNNQVGYNYIASKKAQMYFAQGQETSGTHGICWNQLKAYLDSNLSWNSTLDEQDLINRYFNAMFGEASEKMMEAFLTLRSHYQMLVATNTEIGKLRSNYCRIADRACWPMGTLDKLVKLVDEAKEILVKKEDGNPLFDIHMMNCEAEAVSPLFITLDLYRSTLSQLKRTEICKRILSDVDLLGLDTQFTRENGGASIGGLVTSYMG